VTSYLLRRLSFAALLVFVVSSSAFMLPRLVPGDYATATLGIEARRETAAETRARLGLDRPLAAQYADWLRGAARLDFGRSLLYDRPVTDLIPERAANTAVLAATALFFATCIGIPLGILTGSRRGGFVPAVVRSMSVLLLSMPPLLTSLLFVFIAARTGWAPIGGMRSADAAGGAAADLIRHLVVPAAALALPIAALFERLQGQAIRETLAQPFVLASLSRGVPRARLVWRDALKASLRPVIAVYGLIVGSLLSGSFVVEVITSWPGLGQLTLEALRARDIYLVAGCAAAGALFLAAGTVLSDVALAWADPRTIAA